MLGLALDHTTCPYPLYSLFPLLPSRKKDRKKRKDKEKEKMKK
jgi:hypothetical protein